jgi:hypothetical protein
VDDEDDIFGDAGRDYEVERRATAAAAAAAEGAAEGPEEGPSRRPAYFQAPDDLADLPPLPKEDGALRCGVPCCAELSGGGPGQAGLFCAVLCCAVL